MEEKAELMPVAEAIALTNRNAITIETIAKSIANQAKNGNSSIRYFDISFPFDVMKSVMAAGYSVRQERGMVGENIIIISW